MYNGQVNLLSVDPAVDPFVGRLRLNVRWVPDGSVLSRFPEVRTPQPDLADSGLALMVPFAVDDSGLDGTELVFTVADNVTGELLFRSPLLTTLPTPVTAGAGFFQIIRAATSPTFPTLNGTVASQLAAAPFSQDGITITGATLAASSPPGQINITAVGTQVVTVGGALGSPSVPVTFPFTYTATMDVVPYSEVFSPDRTTSVAVSNENITFTTPAGTPPGFGVTLGAIGPAIAWLLHAAVEPSLDSAVQNSIRTQAAQAMGITGPLPASTTVTLQLWQPTATGVNIRATVGGVAPILPPRAPSGFGCMVIGGLLVSAGALAEIVHHFWSA